jgi:hypothetical protein
MAITAERTAITRLAGVAVLRKRSVEACGLYAVDAVHGRRVNAGDMCLRTILPYSGNATVSASALHALRSLPYH